jgi:phosphohistidine phosphatase
MELILWRHADAEELGAHIRSDNDRQLTTKGQKQAAKMGGWLDSVLPADCQILVSPSQRTLQTAQALGRPFEITDAVGTGTTVEKILAACHWPNNRKSVLVIAHQPHLGHVVSRLIPSMQGVALRKANVWWISQKENGTFLKAVMTPELV